VRDVTGTSLWKRFTDWWRGSSDPEALAEAKRLRDDVETRRVGDMSKQGNIAHRGSESTGRHDFE
jgi:hypothetical protein